MSFNNNHININKSNYEEYFVLYADDELNPEETSAVDEFVAQHPALRVELNLLLSTKLPIENVALPNKETLLAHAIKQNINEADLLLFIDNELSKEAKETVEKKLVANPDLQAQHQLLLKAKLNKNDTITYPFKQQLYRRTNKYNFSAPAFFSVAAAVIVLLFGSIFYINTKEATSPTAATNTIAKHTPAIEPEKAIVIANNKLPDEAIAKVETKVEQRVSKKLASPAPKVFNAPKHSIAEAKINRKVEVKVMDDVAIQPPVITDHVEAVALLKKEKNNKKIIGNDVTITNDEAYNITEATNKPAPQFAAFTKEESNNKTTLKVLLRKATRYIERTTNINTTNEDDELLIGAFAVKL